MMISIITPSFNQGKFIARSIESVKKQCGVEIEHIVFDNCSTDSSSVVLAEYAKNHGNIKLHLYVEHDKGQTSVINRGFLHAAGDVVCWLNTDEFFYDGVLAKVADYFESNPEVDVLFGDFNYVDSDGNHIKTRIANSYSESMLLYYGCYIPSCSTFIRRRVISTGQLLDEAYRVTMDYEYYVRLAKVGYKFAYFKSVLAGFTLHANNISTTQYVRRLHERRMVLDKYSNLRGPFWLRTIIYKFLYYYWIGYRVLQRRIHSTSIVS